MKKRIATNILIGIAIALLTVNIILCFTLANDHGTDINRDGVVNELDLSRLLNDIEVTK